MDDDIDLYDDLEEEHAVNVTKEQELAVLKPQQDAALKKARAQAHKYKTLVSVSNV